MSFTSIDTGNLDVGKPLKKELFDTINGNLEDLNSRVGGIESAVSSVSFFNDLVKKDKDQLPVGSILYSVLTEAQFNAEVEDGEWQLVDGTATSTSDDLYTSRGSSTAVPDLRGRFLRMKSFSSGNDAAGDVALDTYQADQAKITSHTHGVPDHRHDMRHTHQIFESRFVSGKWNLYGGKSNDTSFISYSTAVSTPFTIETRVASAGGDIATIKSETGSWYTTGALSAPSGSGSTAKTGVQEASGSGFTLSTQATSNSTETRPKAIVENAFIKINRNWIKAQDGYLLFRASQNVTVNQVILSPVNNGTAGTLEIDVKKGPLASISTSIFDTRPSIDYDATDPNGGLINATNAVVTAGQYIRVDITAVQSKLADFHLLISASPTA